jgi:uncharacterized protein involved in response to NO
MTASDRLVEQRVALALWVGGFALFALWYGRMLLMPRVSRIALPTVQT